MRYHVFAIMFTFPSLSNKRHLVETNGCFCLVSIFPFTDICSIENILTFNRIEQVKYTVVSVHQLQDI